MKGLKLILFSVAFNAVYGRISVRSDLSGQITLLFGLRDDLRDTGNTR